MAAEPAEEAVVPAPAPPAEAADVEDDEDDADDEPAPVGETEAEKQAALERQVFGGDSGSDLSSDEEDVLRPARTSSRPRHSHTLGTRARPDPAARSDPFRSFSSSSHQAQVCFCVAFSVAVSVSVCPAERGRRGGRGQLL